LIEVTDQVNDHLAEVEPHRDELAAVVVGGVIPRAALKSGCRSCEFFSTECLGKGHAHTVLELGVTGKKFKRLSDAGIIRVSDVPEDLDLTDRQERVRQAILSGNPFVSHDLADALATIQWPCHYLDFETVMTDLPLYDGYGCFKQVLTQFSIHHRDSPTGELRHDEFLVDATCPNERELALALIGALSESGSIVVYSSFEKTRIAALRDQYVDLGEPLAAVLDRLIDLEAIISKNFYHPQFRGSTSIKTVLPVLVPELSYDDLAIGNGGVAVARFAGMARGEIVGSQIAETRRELLDYCNRDTLAMVRVHDALLALAEGHRSTPAMN
jgi:hypothetical protein